MASPMPRLPPVTRTDRLVTALMVRSGALSLRERLQEVPPEAAYQGLVELEEALESATRDVLEGRGQDAGAALEPMRTRLKNGVSV